MNERWCDVDVPSVLARSADPIFMMDERGRIVFANPAFHFLFSIPLGQRAWWRELESTQLKLPEDLTPGDVRRLDVQVGDEGDKRWAEVIYHYLADANGGPLAVLGSMRTIEGKQEAAENITPASAQFHSNWERFREKQRAQLGMDIIPARSPAGARLAHQLKLAASASTPIALVGESGVGKSTLAKWIHNQRSPKAWFVTLDAPALDHDSQVEFLFGKSTDDPSGVLQRPDAGTLLIRHLKEIPLELQARIAVEFSRTEKKNRLIVTERNSLDQGFRAGQVHPELYYYVTRTVIEVPPLRERRQDIPFYCAELLKRQTPGQSPRTLAPDAISMLSGYDWPGNLRELAIVLKTACDRHPDGILKASHFPSRLAPPETRTITEPKPTQLDAALEAVEKRLMMRAHDLFRGNKSRAAEFLGISRARFLRRWEQLRLDNKAGSADEASSDDPGKS